ncbi:M10 family metallopeptidase C-terminal domain-containing protein [Sphingomonas sp. NSE70-1]|uniref:M10 family metallopeptidase C-terminal domain-containing protein n=1 Tax=Sphingomonas caseinilyticus TaxID=2908205 RepID=A0ABT0RWS6_9SPHN|nr:M10 family metallopeptidase C-terminal domain-containing protein [Sphingomonas caseinilyticus]
MVDVPGNSTTTRSISVGGTVTDSLEVAGDHDWFQIQLTAGQSISVALDGLTLIDPYLRIRDSSGNIIFENDDITSGINRDSLLGFTATYTGTYYIDVGAWDPPPDSPDYPGYTGTYQLSVETYTPPPVGTVDQLADYLVDGYWGGESRHFDVAPGGSITVNLTALTAPARTLALAALATWTDIIGITFVQVATGGQITFDDNEEGAFSNSIWSNGIITSSHVNVSVDWLADYGTSLNGYSFQTYVHEIGHALGLGHQGGYNGDASYPFEAVFLNDGWPLSVMSYFDQIDNTYFAGQGFDFNYVVTPMMADILAMSMLYGLSTTTRAGNTTYGPSWSSTMGALCIFDSGGVDTIDVSGLAGSHLINLNPGTFSNVLGEEGNVSIAFGVSIENAIGGAGDDTLIGNAANNVLNGGAGEDVVSYETATAAVQVDLRTTAQQNTVGAGLDTLSGFERLIGSAYGDTLTGTSTTLKINGGDGNDVIISTGAGDHRLFGDGGDDRFVPGQGNDWMIGGDGFDTVDYGGAAGSIYAVTNGSGANTGNSGFDTISVEKLIGSNFDDTLWAWEVGHQVWGGAGNDTLKGSWLGSSQLYGGSGNDIYEVRHSASQVIEAAGEGIDLVMAEANFTLSANVENLTLVQPIYDPYGGAALQPPPFDDFSGTGNNLANVITGNRGDNILSGMAGLDTLTGGEGNDIFRDTAAGLNGDTITDFAVGDRIVISDASLAGFSFSLSGSTLTYTGGTLTLSGVSGMLVASAAAGGVQLTLKTSSNDARNDFNGDGRSDILWRNDNGQMTNWLGEADGGFAYNDANAANVIATDWHIAGVGDFNGDGRDDILWRRDNGQMTNWLGEADGGFAYNDANAANVIATDWRIAGVGDFNGDGRDDILWRRDNGQMTNWLGEADGGFAYNDANAANVIATDWHVQPSEILWM